MGHVLYGVRLIWDNVLGQLGHVLYETRSGTTGTRGTRLIWDTFWDTWGNRGKRGKWGKSDSGYVLFGVNAKAQSFPSGDKMIWGISVYRRVVLGYRASLRTSVGCRPLIPSFGVLSGKMDLPEGKDCRRSLSPSSGVVSGEIDYRSLIFIGLGPIGGVMEAII